MKQKNKQKKSKDEEQVLTIKSSIIFERGKWQGLKTDDLNYYIDLIKNNCQFKNRAESENDASLQQIIPYIIFSFGNNYFLYKYLEKAGEKRLVNTFQLGIGGHINPIDSFGKKDILEAGMMREWEEEVEFKGKIISKKLVGIINDDSRMVEEVHLGLVYHFNGDSPEIKLKEANKMSGEMVDINNIDEYIKNNDGVWVKIVYNEYLKKLIITA